MVSVKDSNDPSVANLFSEVAIVEYGRRALINRRRPKIINKMEKIYPVRFMFFDGKIIPQSWVLTFSQVLCYLERSNSLGPGKY
jgi:hypothetical protein